MLKNSSRSIEKLICASILFFVFIIITITLVDSFLNSKGVTTDEKCLVVNQEGVTTCKKFTEHPRNNEAVLAMIDGVCGDTWCEGDFDYNFKSIECNQDHCVVGFLMWLENSIVTNHKCFIYGKYTLKNIIDGEWLRDDFYEKLTVCVSNQEGLYLNIIGGKND